MKLERYKLFLAMTGKFAAGLIMSIALLFSACEQDGDGMHIESPNGPPVIDYIRQADPATSDSLLVGATLGTGIVIVGKNLGGTREVWFNDKQVANLTPTWVTNRTVFVSVPSIAPGVVSNTLSLIDASGNKLEHPFVVAIPGPELFNAKNEWPQEGEHVVINGDYFFEPLTVTFSGGVAGEVLSVSQTQLEVVVPEGAAEGPVTVTTNFGPPAVSTFHLWDKRNTILNFDDKVANGWRIGLRENSDGPLDGNYLVVRGNIAKNQRDEGPGAPAQSPLMMEYWGRNDPSRPEGNFYPLYPNSYRDYVLKFEAKINKWYGGYLNIVLAPWSQANNADVWNNPFVNARAIWGPWNADNEEYSTDGQWVTVVIPLTDFQYDMGAPNDVVYTPGFKFVETAAGSISTWLLGSPESSGNAVEFYIDNIRIVEP